MSTCLILSVELSEETHRLTDFIGKKYLGEERSKGKGTQDEVTAASLGLDGNWVSFRIVSGQSF